MDNLQLPKGLRPMATQVAGHNFQTNTNALGLIQDAVAGCVLKPLGKPECGEREMSFYESVQQRSNDGKDSDILRKAKMLIPKFYGRTKLIVNQSEHTFIKLEDLTRGMLKPCIMDIKIGKRTWDPLATTEKRDVEEQKYAKCKQVLGLCLPGFQLYTLESHGQVLRFSKEYGKKLDAQGFRRTIAQFLNARPPVVCLPLIREILKQLKAIRSWFQTQRLFHFYASSLLIVYDFVALQTELERQHTLHCHNGEVTKTNGGSVEISPPSNNDWSSLVDPSSWVKVKMIDFAHVFPAEQGMLDENYLFGLENLINVIEELLIR